MPRKLVTLALAGACLLATAQPARAERGLWEWLERLSGPGPFHGWAGEVPFACRLVKINEDSGVRLTTDSKLDYLWHCWSSYTFQNGRPQYASTATSFWERKSYASFHFGRYTGQSGELIYATDPGRQRNVIWWKAGPTFTWEVHKYFDLHTGIEWNHLSSDDGSFKGFSVPSIELMGISWRPLAKLGRRWGNVQIPLRANLLARSFQATDFGAVPGTYKARPEVQFQFGLVYDFWRHQ